MTGTELLDGIDHLAASGAKPGGDGMATACPLSEAELAREPQQVLRRLGLPPHTPTELVSQALLSVRVLVGQGIRLQQEALKSSPLFAWLEEHAGARLDASSLAIALRSVTTG